MKNVINFFVLETKMKNSNVKNEKKKVHSIKDTWKGSTTLKKFEP
jgi:hypothetical protein